MARYGYCFTLNNYTPDNELALQGSIGQCGISYMSYGREVGAQGTPHLQGYLQSNQKNKSRFHDKLGIYVMPQQRSAIQARDYTMKDNDYWQAGSFDENIKGTKEKNQGQRSDHDTVKDMIDTGKSYEDIIDTNFGYAAKYSRFIKERIQERDCTKQAGILRTQYENTSLRSWQTTLMTNVSGPSDPRKIMWYWDNKGSTGKSFMANYLGLLHGATILTGGRYPDMAYIYSQKPTKIVLFDLSRTTEDYLKAVYSMAEHLKSGRIVSTKYESRTVWTGNPHVVVFANFKPDPTVWSIDRYDITQLD